MKRKRMEIMLLEYDSRAQPWGKGFLNMTAMLSLGEMAADEPIMDYSVKKRINACPSRGFLISSSSYLRPG